MFTTPTGNENSDISNKSESQHHVKRDRFVEVSKIAEQGEPPGDEDETLGERMQRKAEFAGQKVEETTKEMTEGGETAKEAKDRKETMENLAKPFKKVAQKMKEAVGMDEGNETKPTPHEHVD